MTPAAQASDPHLWGLSPIVGRNPCVPCPGPRQLRSLWVRATHPTHARWALPISVQCSGLWSPRPALPTCLLGLPLPLPPSPLSLLSPLAQGCCPFAYSLMARPAVGWTVSRASPASLAPRVQTGHGQVACTGRWPARPGDASRPEATTVPQAHPRLPFSQVQVLDFTGHLMH